MGSEEVIKIIVSLNRRMYEVRVIPADASVKKIKRTCRRCKEPYSDHVFVLIVLSVSDGVKKIAQDHPLYKQIERIAKEQYFQTIRDNQARDYICERDRCLPEHVEEVDDTDSELLQSLCPRCKDQAIAVVHRLDDTIYDPMHHM